jgi:hypothetical protein
MDETWQFGSSFNNIAHVFFALAENNFLLEILVFRKEKSRN